MDPVIIGTWLPIYILLFIIIPQQLTLKNIVILKKVKKKRGVNMTNELIKRYIGQNCFISTGALGKSITGKIIEINENWIEVETKKGNEIMNLDFIQNIKLKNK